MRMLNNQSGGFKEFLSRGVPLHTVDFPRDPLAVVGIGAEFRKSGNRQDVIEGIIKAKHNQLSGVGTAIVLGFQLFAKKLSVLCGFKAVGRCFLKVAGFTQRVPSAFHGFKAWVLSAPITCSSFGHSLLPCCCRCLNFILTVLAVNKTRYGRALATVSAQARSFQSVVSLHVMSSVGDLPFLCLAVSFRGGIYATASFFNAKHVAILPRCVREQAQLSHRLTVLGGVQ